MAMYESEKDEEYVLLKTMQVTVVTDGTAVQQVISNANIDVSAYDKLAVIYDCCNGFYAYPVEILDIKRATVNSYAGGSVNWTFGGNTNFTIGYNQTSKKLGQLVFSSKSKNSVGSVATGRIFGIKKA